MNNGGGTTVDELSRQALDMFGGKFMGALVNPESPLDIKRESRKLNDNEFFLVLLNGHWTAIYKIKGRVYEYDSFGRDVHGDDYVDGNRKKEQKLSERNCGQRTLDFVKSKLN